MYSGFPTIELAGIISDYILPNDNLAGIYHVSSEPISKYDLLCLIADRYGKKIEIVPFDEVVIDRSLDSSAFRSLTGYAAPSWPELINKMYCFQAYKTWSFGRGQSYLAMLKNVLEIAVVAKP